MRLLHLLPVALLILLAETALGTVPAVVAEREGGMGIGSALVAAQLAQMAGLGFGAAVGAHLAGRWPSGLVFVAGALLVYGGLIGVGHQPAHLLGWVVGIAILAGVGIGIALTAAFTMAAAVPTRGRQAAVALLLLAVLLAAHLVAPVDDVASVPVLVLVGAALVAGALALAWREQARGAGAAIEGPGVSLGAALAGGLILGVGVLAALWGLDPSRVSATLVAGPFGGLEVLDGVRIGLVIGGVVLTALGAVVVGRGARSARSTTVAATGVLFVALAATGVLTVVAFAMPAVLSPAQSGGAEALVALAGGAAGLAAGAWLVGRGAPASLVALGGAFLVGAVALVALVGGGRALQSAGASVLLLATAAAALGGGLAAASLRAALAAVPVGQRAFAAAAGVAAAGVGSMAGLMIGAGEGTAIAFGGTSGVPLGLVALLVAAAVGAGAASALPSRR